MRTFQSLDRAAIDTTTGIITLTKQDDSTSHPSVSMRREGEYVVISASYGPFEIALRSRYDQLTRTLSQLQANDGLNTTRQVGTGQAFLGLGKRKDNSLILRPTIVGDASGYFCINLTLTAEPAAILIDWLGTDAGSNPEGLRL